MAKSNIASDILMVLNGVRKVLETGISMQKASCETKLRNSSLRSLAQDLPNLGKTMKSDNPNYLERAMMVPQGVQQFATEFFNSKVQARTKAGSMHNENRFGGYDIRQATDSDEEDILLIHEDDLEDVYMKSLGVEIMQQNEDGKKWVEQYEQMEKRSEGLKEKVMQSILNETPVGGSSTSSKTEKQSSPSVFSPSPPTPTAKSELRRVPKPDQTRSEAEVPKITLPKPKPDLEAIKRNLKPLSTHKPKSQLAPTSKERKVPASRLSRLISYGGLAAGLGIGALTEVTKRSFGLTNPNSQNTSLLEGSPFLSEANAERIVDTLCKVRGAALKIGQILSIQDNTMINPQLQKVFERVRHAADFMPSWQMERMMESNFGPEWRSVFSEFDERPFAAASIGQVHLAKLHDGRSVAVKIQYPGVAKGIESDIDNLMSVLSVWSILPDGIFADNLIEVAKRELAWEVDYERESKCARIFRKLLVSRTDYYVPEVIKEVTTKNVYTTELIEGIAADKCEDLSQETRDRISRLLLELFFIELFEFRFMQTDPNWSNFVYNTRTEQIGLLDFGASREYKKEFVDKYLTIFAGGANQDHKTILEASRDIGFLTGYESKTMEKAHIDSVLILSEAFHIGDEPYDFGTQKVTARIQELVPVMVKERLCPPPEEIYSLHRKLSGVFLLCARLRGRVQCRPIFDKIWSEYKFGSDSRTIEERIQLD